MSSLHFRLENAESFVNVLYTSTDHLKQTRKIYKLCLMYLQVISSLHFRVGDAESFVNDS